MELDLRISAYDPEDEEQLFSAYAVVVADGGAFPRKAPVSKATFRGAWCGEGSTVFVARLAGRLAGSYYLRPAFPDLASHIANAGYLVVPKLRRQGIGRALAEHSIMEARKQGYDAMLFNLVLERNPSRRLWQRLGFEEAGRIPNAVEGQAGIVYWRSL